MNTHLGMRVGAYVDAFRHELTGMNVCVCVYGRFSREKRPKRARTQTETSNLFVFVFVFVCVFVCVCERERERERERVGAFRNSARLNY